MVSSRGAYTFPLVDSLGAPVNDTSGIISATSEVSSSDLYSGPWGSSVDRDFQAIDRNSYAAGEFV